MTKELEVQDSQTIELERRLDTAPGHQAPATIYCLRVGPYKCLEYFGHRFWLPWRQMETYCRVDRRCCQHQLDPSWQPVCHLVDQGLQRTLGELSHESGIPRYLIRNSTIW
jgi:hypothetical protein